MSSGVVPVKETHTITIDEGERQAILLAMAHMTVERPGWEYMYTEIAKKMDNVIAGVPELYTRMLLLRRQRVANSLPDQSDVMFEASLKKSLGCTRDFFAGLDYGASTTDRAGSTQPRGTKGRQ